MSIVIIIIIITGIITYMGFSDHQFIEKYKFSVSGIQAGEYYRYITSAFLHADWMHFFVNMFTLYFFGDYFEEYFGMKSFLIIYFGGIIAGNYLSYYFHRNDLWYSAIGASAGVNALLFAFVTLEPTELIFLFAILPIPALLFAVGYLWYTTKESQNTASRIGHEAHFGGAIAGVVLIILLDYQIIYHTHPWVAVLLLLILWYGFDYMRKHKL